MMVDVYFWVVTVMIGWIVGAVFVGAVGGATRGVQGFFVWLLLALIFSPLLALLGLNAVLLGDLVREMQIKAIHGPEDILPPLRRSSGPSGSSGRFAHLAGEDD
jgi:uncharacterized membrane protein YhdT